MVLLTGCDTGTRYANTPTPDATTIVASSSVSPGEIQSEGGMLVKVEKIDRGDCSRTAALPRTGISSSDHSTEG